MFERFSGEARAVVAGSQDEARRLGGPRIEALHLLLAMLNHASLAGDALAEQGLTTERLRAHLATAGLDGNALASLGIDLGQVRVTAERQFGPGALNRPVGRRVPGGHLPFTPAAKQALEQALRAAAERHAGVIDSAHLLLGVLRADDRAVIALLAESGVNTDQLAAGCTARAGRQAA